MAQTPRYTERLTVAWWLWLPAIALVGLLAIEVYLIGPSARTWLPYLVLLPFATVLVWWLGRIRVTVQDDELLPLLLERPDAHARGLAAAGEHRPGLPAHPAGLD